MPTEIPREWSWGRLGDLCARVTRKNGDSCTRVLTASGEHGLIDQGAVSLGLGAAVSGVRVGQQITQGQQTDFQTPGRGPLVGGIVRGSHAPA